MLVSQKKKILIVDDNPEVTRTMKLGVELIGIDVVTFNDPVDAVEAFKAGSYDLVVLDFQMPKMNGFQVYREMRKVDPRVKICFLTAFDIYKSEFKTVFPELDVYSFLKKPILASDLAEQLNELLIA
jgi:two-component system, OmpR family, response regulator ChvI